jgi:hypothetical protein
MTKTPRQSQISLDDPLQQQISIQNMFDAIKVNQMFFFFFIF